MTVRSRTSAGRAAKDLPDRATKRALPLGSRLDRYVAAHFVWSYASALGLLLGLFLVIDMASNLDRWLEPWEDGSTPSALRMARYYVLQLPFQYLQIAPFVTLLAGMFTVNRLLRKNEVSAVLSAGVSVHRMMLPVFTCGALLTLGMFVLRGAIGHGLADARDAQRDALEERGGERVFRDIVVRDLSGSMAILDRYHPSPPDGGPPYAEGLTLRLRRDDRYLRIQAQRAEWRDGSFHLEEGRRSAVQLGHDVALDAPVEVLEGFELSPEIISTYQRSKEPLDLSFREVGELIRREPDHPAWLTLWHYHLTFPLANLILLLAGLPVMFSYERGGSSERMAIGGLISIFYFGTDFVLRTLGLAGGLDPVWAAWLPVLTFGSLGVVLTEGVRT